MIDSAGWMYCVLEIKYGQSFFKNIYVSLRLNISIHLPMQILFTVSLCFFIYGFSLLSVPCSVFQRNCREKAVSRRWVTARAPQVAAFLVTLKVTALLCRPTRASRSAFTPQLSPRAASPLWQPFHPITGNCSSSSVQMDFVVCNVDLSFHLTNRREKSGENPFTSDWKQRRDLHAGFQEMCRLILIV